MKDNIKERLNTYLHTKGISVYEIAKAKDFNQPTLQRQIKGDTAMTVKVLEAVLDYCGDLSAEWLLRGEGTMIKQKDAPGIVYNVPCQVSESGTNIGRDYNESDNSDMLKYLMQQNQELMKMLAERSK